MLNGNGTAYATGAALCKRFFVGFAGCALGARLRPATTCSCPTRSARTTTSRPAPRRSRTTATSRTGSRIVSGLRIPYDGGSGIPDGGWAHDFHIQALGPLISGVRNHADDDYGVNGVTADQVVADAIGAGTTFASLQYQVQAAWYLTVARRTAAT